MKTITYNEIIKWGDISENPDAFWDVLRDVKIQELNQEAATLTEKEVEHLYRILYET